MIVKEIYLIPLHILGMYINNNGDIEDILFFNNYDLILPYLEKYIGKDYGFRN